MHIYIDADYKKHDISHLRLYWTRACRYSFATSTHVYKVVSMDFVKRSRCNCCLWSAQSIKTKAMTSDNVKTWVFTSFNVQWWSFIDNVVFCNILPSIKAALLELEKAMFTGATPVPMFTIITPRPHTYSIQSKTFHAKFNLRVNYEKKNGFYNQKWLYECCRSQSNSQRYVPCS